MKNRIQNAFDGVQLNTVRKEEIIDNVIKGSVKERKMKGENKNFWQSKWGGIIVVATALIVFVVVNCMMLGIGGRKATPAGNGTDGETISILESDSMEEKTIEQESRNTQESISVQESTSAQENTYEQESLSLQEDISVQESESATVENEVDMEEDCESTTLEIENISEGNFDVQIDFPVKGYILTSGYGERYGNFHDGICMTSSGDDNIYLPISGMITTAEFRTDDGNTIAVDHGNGVVTEYCHLDKMLVGVGDVVAVGDIIGIMGNTGMATGKCLHWRVLADGEVVNPIEYLEINIKEN